ncbi:hypothetical protein [Salinigranum halophilum]|nr:hypothetical protein [Salinigranum halophilum]
MSATRRTAQAVSGRPRPMEAMRGEASTTADQPNNDDTMEW